MTPAPSMNKQFNNCLVRLTSVFFYQILDLEIKLKHTKYKSSDVPNVCNFILFFIARIFICYALTFTLSFNSKQNTKYYETTYRYFTLVIIYIFLLFFFLPTNTSTNTIVSLNLFLSNHLYSFMLKHFVCVPNPLCELCVYAITLIVLLSYLKKNDPFLICIA